jgi:hypothetical protein
MIALNVFDTLQNVVEQIKTLRKSGHEKKSFASIQIENLWLCEVTGFGENHRLVEKIINFIVVSL